MDDRRHNPEAKKRGAPAWMVTFGDLMALLLTFFVLMLSLSSVNQEKYQSVSEAMGESFGLESVRIPGLSRWPGNNSSLIEQPYPQFTSGQEQTINSLIRQDFDSELNSGLLSLMQDDGKIRVVFPDRLASQPDSDELTPEFRDIINKMARILSRIPGQIEVGGHTDNRSVQNSHFASNWALSSARAVAVVQALIDSGLIEAQRLSAVGYADTRPLVGNQTPELRARNRRVEFTVILPQP